MNRVKKQHVRIMPTILIADDDPTYRTLLDRALTRLGHIVVVCEDGDQAWNSLSTKQPPDIAILDWYMPGYTGPELCERHAKLEDSRFTYKIILSGRMEKQDVIEALHRGAHDILEKPCDLKILEYRLKTAIKIVEEKRVVEEFADVMQRYAKHMEYLANERATQLIHAERMSSLGVLAAGIAHEINNPMSFISGNVQNIQRYWTDLEPLLKNLQESTTVPKNKIDFIIKEMPSTLESIMKGVVRVSTIVKGLKKYSGKQEKALRETFNINECIEQALELCRGAINKNTSVDLMLSSNLNKVNGNPLEIEQVIVNLIVNASQALESKETKIITISSYADEYMVHVKVEDTGTGIPEELLTKIWDPFVTTKPIGQGTGLGLSVSSGIIKKHGGKIVASNRPEGGAQIQFSLPITGMDT